MIRASEVATLLNTTVSSERIARELAPLIDIPEAAREVWAEVQEEHGNKVTAADVHEAVDRRLCPVTMRQIWLVPTPYSAARRVIGASLAA